MNLNNVRPRPWALYGIEKHGFPVARVVLPASGNSPAEVWETGKACIDVAHSHVSPEDIPDATGIYPPRVIENAGVWYGIRPALLALLTGQTTAAAFNVAGLRRIFRAETEEQNRKAAALVEGKQVSGGTGPEFYLTEISEQWQKIICSETETADQLPAPEQGKPNSRILNTLRAELLNKAEYSALESAVACQQFNLYGKETEQEVTPAEVYQAFRLCAHGIQTIYIRSVTGATLTAIIQKSKITTSIEIVPTTGTTGEQKTIAYGCADYISTGRPEKEEWQLEILWNVRNTCKPGNDFFRECRNTGTWGTWSFTQNRLAFVGAETLEPVAGNLFPDYRKKGIMPEESELLGNQPFSGEIACRFSEHFRITLDENGTFTVREMPFESRVYPAED
jgi:hypothetical protein